MPTWVKFLLLGIGLLFLVVGVLVGVVGSRQMQQNLAHLEQLRSMNATVFDDQQPRAEVLVEGVISERNPVILNNAVAYIREELDIRTDSDGDRVETWRSTGRETPRLFIDADGLIVIGNESYSIDNPHTTWYDENTLGFNNRPRDGTMRYYGLVAHRVVTVHGDVGLGTEGNELLARTIFGGTHEEFIASQRKAVAVMPLLGGIFGFVGLILCVIGIVAFFKRW